MSDDFFDIRDAYQKIEAERASRMGELLDVSRIMNATLDEEVLLPFLMDRVVDLMEADRGHLVLLRPSQEHLDGGVEAEESFPWDIKVSLVRGRKGKGARDPLLSKTVIRQVLQGRKPLLIEDALQDDLVSNSRSVYELGLRSVMAAPLISRNRVIGVLSVENRMAVGVFNNEDLDFLQIFAAQAAVAIENAGLYRNLRDTQNQLAQAHKALKIEVVESQQALKSERQRLQTLEMEIGHLDKMAAMGMMVSSIAHELNNPLTGALGFAELLGRGKNLDAKQQRMLGHITSEMGRCAEIIRSLLKFSRKSKEKREVISLGSLVSDAIELRRYQFSVNDVEILEDFEAPLPSVMADAYQLKGVILNLLNNAFDAVRSRGEGGRIWVSVRQDGDRLVAEVRDEGGGIRDLEKIFDPFYTTKDVGKGTGLGLSVAYGVVHSHGGRISAENIERGAKLTVALPITRELAPPPTMEPPKVVEVSAPRSNLRVLVVDDEMVVRDLCKALLEGEGYHVEMAASGREGQSALREEDYDLIITDIRMPGGMSGMDLYKWMADERSWLCNRVLFITGDLLTLELREAMDNVGQRVITKPFDVTVFLGAVRETFERAEQQRDADDTSQAGGEIQGGEADVDDDLDWSERETFT